jgi:hypothetical protein
VKRPTPTLLNPAGPFNSRRNRPGMRDLAAQTYNTTLYVSPPALHNRLRHVALIGEEAP